MNRTRLATAEEIELISKVSDLDDSCIVLALTTQQGAPLAVVRTAIEVDPVIYPEGLHDRVKAMFQRDIEMILDAKGVKTYYFNVLADNESMIKVADTLGAIRTSIGPEFRYKKIL